MTNKKYISIILALATVGAFALAIPVFAQTEGQPGEGSGRFEGGMMPGVRNGMGISGAVASISGTTLTVTGRARATTPGATVTTVTYTVDASNAKVTKNGQTSSVSAIAVGDTVMVQGTISGTNVTAKIIRDGLVQPVMQGNGQPVVGGKVTAISGNTITITNNSNVTYTVDATNAKILEGNQTSTISSIAVGDNLIVQGTVNGNSVTAFSVIDQKGPGGYPPNKNNHGQGKKQDRGFMGGMMDGIGNFFKHIFGF